ncbi:site-specific integrase [Pleomorphomonas oryzae]|uniref:site-specific integrase n=1 Tax=Pleomorphomonas oryzae TaxID=261934 RepID=UPI0004791E2E|nr:site-specific integrase [Pleomorphomonas oryzae]
MLSNKETNGSSWREAINRLEGAYSDQTLRSYRSDFAIFDSWCIANNLCSLPASPSALAAFIAAQAPELAANTLRRRLAGIRKVHRLFHLQNPAEDEDVQIAMRRALRSRTRRPRQALGLTKELRDQLAAACSTDLAGLRDRALIVVGYDTMCRRSELAALRVEDLTSLDDGSMLALIRRAKNDPFGDGRDGLVSVVSAEALKAWLEAANISDGWLFRRVNSGRVGAEALHPHSIGRILKQRALAGGLPAEIVSRISGHSMRVGAAQDMVANGADILPIMRSGGWKSINVVARYVQNVELTRLAGWRR